MVLAHCPQIPDIIQHRVELGWCTPNLCPYTAYILTPWLFVIVFLVVIVVVIVLFCTCWVSNLLNSGDETMNEWNSSLCMYTYINVDTYVNRGQKLCWNWSFTKGGHPCILEAQQLHERLTPTMPQIWSVSTKERASVLPVWSTNSATDTIYPLVSKF